MRSTFAIGHRAVMHQTRQLSASARGLRAPGLLPTYLSDARSLPAFHEDLCPEGVLNLSVAENHLVEDLIVNRINDLQRRSSCAFSGDMIYYQPTHGREDCRQAIAAHLSRVLGGGEYGFDDECLVIGAGCNAVLENLVFAIGESGEGVLVPTPYYAAFDFDLCARAGMRMLPVSMEGNRSGSAVDVGAYYPSVEDLQRAYDNGIESGVTPRALLLSSPNNPLGFCYPEGVLADCLQWCEERDVHLISDEIYGGSVFGGEWCGIGQVAARRGRKLGDKVHIVWSLSKDFALSGLRFGALYTENEDIQVPLRKLNDLCCVPSATQVLVREMLSDEAWVQNFERESKRRTRERYEALVDCLDRHSIPHLPATAGLFCWIDLREWLRIPPSGAGDIEGEQAQRAERELYLKLMKEFGLLLTPGLSMKAEEPGLFRCVFTAAGEKGFEEALKRFDLFGQSPRIA